MGVNYSAHTIIGCEIDTDKLYKEVELFEDGHNCKGYRELCEMGKRTHFCPDCGAEAYRVELRCTVPEYEKRETLGGIQVITVQDRTFLAAYHQENDEDGSGGVSFDPNGVLETFHMEKLLKDVLEPLGMWDGRTFGTWTILAVSG